MTAISVISLLITVTAAVVLAAVLGKRKAGGTIAAASAVEVALAMGVIFTALSIAQASIIYDNQKLGGRYVTEGISLSVLPTACGIMLAAAAVIMILCVTARLNEGKIKRLISFAVLSAVTVISATVTVIAVAKSGMYPQYVAMILPAVPVLAWTCLVAVSDILLGRDKKGQRVALIVINLINLLLTAAVDTGLIVLANGVFREAGSDAVGIILLSLGMIIMTAPAMVTFICAVVKKRVPSEG